MSSHAPSPGMEPLFPAPEKDDLSTHGHRQLIGVLGMALPFLLRGLDLLRPTAALGSPKLLDSVSSYYYSGGVAAFVGVLCALAVFLFTYRGYDNEQRWADRVVAIVAGVAALGVAFFPGLPPADAVRPSWWRPWTGTMHVVSAVTLFGMFAIFSLVLFPLTSTKSAAPLPSEKRIRNWIYRACGLGILASLAWAFVSSRQERSMFWAESAALILFAASWLTKGRIVFTVTRTVRRTSLYARDPRLLYRHVTDALIG